MFEKGRSIITKILMLIICFLILILVAKYVVPYVSNFIELNFEKKVPKMYFITKLEELYGVVDNKGRINLEIKYEKIARNRDTVYIKDDKNSYLYSLTSKQSVRLNGKETDVLFAYDKNNDLLPYFIMQYGKNPSEYIYRIYTLEGKRHLNNDFATLIDAKKALESKDGYVSKDTLKDIMDKFKDKYTTVVPINHLSKAGERQFIAVKKEEDDDKQSNKYGIISESGKVIIDFKMKKIENIENCYNAVLIEDENNRYIYNSDEKLISVDRNFEYIVNEYYIIQKKGNNITKIFDIDGNIIINDLFNLDSDIRFVTNIENNPYVIVDRGNNNFEMYDMKNKKKLDQKLGMFDIKLIDSEMLNIRKDTLIYSKLGVLYALDLKTFNELKLSDKITNYSSLDYGILYQ